jgi:hypothetical protein
VTTMIETALNQMEADETIAALELHCRCLETAAAYLDHLSPAVRHAARGALDRAQARALMARRSFSAAWEEECGQALPAFDGGLTMEARP